MDCVNSLIFKKLSEQYESLLESGNLSDVVLVAGGKEIKVHKVVLSARSPVFSAMFAHDSTKEAQVNRVEITDIDVEVLKVLIKYIYTGKVIWLKCDKAAELFVAAHKYQLDCLKLICVPQLLSQISTESVSDLFIFSDMDLVTELTTECIIEYIIDNVTEVMASEGWKKLVVRADLMAKLYKHLQLKYSKLINVKYNKMVESKKKEGNNGMHLVTELTTKCVEYIIENGTQMMQQENWKKIVARADLVAMLFKHLSSKYTRE